MGHWKGTLWEPLKKKLFGQGLCFRIPLYIVSIRDHSEGVKERRGGSLFLPCWVMQSVAVTQDDHLHWHFSPYTDVTQRDALSPGDFHYTSQNALPTTTPLVGVEGSALDWAEIEDPGDWEGEDERDWEAVSSYVGLSALVVRDSATGRTVGKCRVAPPYSGDLKLAFFL